MLGIVYTSFSDMVIEREGMPFWNEVLEKVNPESEGAYTTAAEYADKELMQLIATVSAMADQDVQKLVKLFGEYLFAHLMKYCPVNTDDEPSLIAFLSSINDRVHDEVKRVHPNAYVPSFEVLNQSSTGLTLIYRSERKLCSLCEGLLQGAAGYFNSAIRVTHNECMLRGNDHCRLQIDLQ